jgi:hypothetical protein
MDDEFEPRLGRIRSHGSKSDKRYAHQLRAAVNRAGGKQTRKPGSTLSRIGRGARQPRPFRRFPPAPRRR